MEEKNVNFWETDKPISDVSKRIKKVLEESARQQISEVDPVKDSYAQRLSKLYYTGSDSPIVYNDIERHRLFDISENERVKQSKNSNYSNTKDNESIVNRIRSKVIQADSPKNVNSYFLNTSSHSNSNNQYTSLKKPENTQHMRIHRSLHIQDKLPGGKYHIPEISEPYNPSLQNKVVHDSIVNINTPKHWKVTGYTNSSNRPTNDHRNLVKAHSGPCSKSLTLNNAPITDIAKGSVNKTTHITGDINSMSELQKTLISCGKLHHVNDLHTYAIESEVKRSEIHHLKLLESHGEWLQNKNKDQKGQSKGNGLASSIASPGINKFTKGSPHNNSLSTISTIDNNSAFYGRFLETDEKSNAYQNHHQSNSVYDSSLIGSNSKSDIHKNGKKHLLHGKGSVTANHINKITQDMSYDQMLVDHLNLNLVDNSKNPYRPMNKYANRMHKSSAISNYAIKNNTVDCKLYNKHTNLTNIGKYTAVIQNNLNTKLPSQEFLTKGLVQLSRRILVCYDTKIVETGALLKALQDIRLPTPGMASIIALHRAFIDAASMNPSHWWLSREQFSSVILQYLPWISPEAVNRLISAYDPSHSGVVKYIKLTTTLLCGNRPAMIALMATLSKDPLTVDKSGSVFLLRFIHGMYEECDGGLMQSGDDSSTNDSKWKSKKAGVGMRLEDVIESLSTCCCNVDDELRISNIAEDVVQVLYEQGQKKDVITNTNNEDVEDMSLSQSNSSNSVSRPSASKILKYQYLTSVKSIPRVSEDEYIQAITKNTELCQEFASQLQRIRDLMKPYTITGSVTYEESCHSGSVYGSIRSGKL